MSKPKPLIEKELKPLYRVAVSQGWHVEKRRRSGHNVWISPEGTKVFHGSTSSDWRSNRNLAASLKRAGLRL